MSSFRVRERYLSSTQLVKQMVELQWNHPVEKLRNCRGYSIGSSSSQKTNGLIVRNSEMVNRR